MTALTQINAHSCRFCSLQDGLRSAIWDQVLACDGDVELFPSKGAIVAPWFLIVPRSHVPSAALLSQQEKKSVSRIIRKVQYLAASVGQTLVIFENGSPYFGADVTCGIEHAHIHMVALNFDLVHELQLRLPGKIEAGAPWLPMTTTLDIPYIFVDNGESQSYFDASDAPSQFVRQLIANANGCSNRFHYDLFPYTENVAATVDWFYRLSRNLLLPSARSNF